LLEDDNNIKLINWNLYYKY